MAAESRESSRALRAFLCHSSEDKPAVRKLYQWLREEGIDPWLDEENLLAGQEWEEEIPSAVQHSDVVIVCLSPTAITKAGYVQKEIKYALDVAEEQPERTIFIIPLKLEACDVPRRLRRWQWVDFFEEHGRERLMRALQARAKQIGTSAPNLVELHPESASLLRSHVEAPSTRYHDSVFINSPFGESYEPIFRALVFTVFDCGYLPRCVLELDNTSQTKFEKEILSIKILSIMKECQFGIHDISAVGLNQKSQLSQFNVPFELGLFLGAMQVGSKGHKEKRLLILERDWHHYQQFLSDIAEYDIKSYNAADDTTIIRSVGGWLARISLRRDIIVPSAGHIANRYELFKSELEAICRELFLTPA
jgi:hypothetical protein